MHYTFRQQKFLCTLWSLALAKKSCNNINNSRAQVSRPDYVISCDYVFTLKNVKNGEEGEGT